MNHIELSKRALKNLRRIDHVNRRRLWTVLEQDLAAEPQPPNLDVKPLVGRAPWLRLRRGAYRILYRPLTDAELRTLLAGEQAGFLVERIIDRGDLERATATSGQVAMTRTGRQASTRGTARTRTESHVLLAYAASPNRYSSRRNGPNR